MPNQVGGGLLHTMSVTRLSRVRTELQVAVGLRTCTIGVRSLGSKVCPSMRRPVDVNCVVFFARIAETFCPARIAGKAERSEFILSLDGGRAGVIEVHPGEEKLLLLLSPFTMNGLFACGE